MCTAATYKTKDFYFGRTFDNECSYSEQVVITPRNYPFKFMHMGTVDSHYAMIGIAHVEQDYPLYYDAVNEKGLGMAGLNFPGYARYNPITPGKENIAVFELIQWLLCDCATVSECKEKIARMNLADIPFNDKLPVATLHWIIADSDGAVTLEATAQGMNVYDNPVGVMANNPTFPEHMFHLNNYMQLSAKPPQNNFAKGLALSVYCKGMGAIGLPGDLSSQSRFVRAAFVKMNSVSGESEDESVGQFSISLVRLSSRGDVVNWRAGNMRGHSIHPAATPCGEYITTQLTGTGRLRLLICTGRSLMKRGSFVIRWLIRSRSCCKMAGDGAAKRNIVFTT